MKNQDKLSKIIGVLFIIPLFAYGIGDSLISFITSQDHFLSIVQNQQEQVVIGALLLLLNSIVVVMIGVGMYSLLKKENEFIASGYLIARIIEAVLLIGGMVSLLLLLPLSQTNENILLANLMIKANFYAFQTAMIVLGIGSIFGFYQCWKSNLLPSLFSWWAIIGYVLLVFGSVLELFGFEVGVMCSIIGGVFEIALGIYLLIKGFKLPNHSEPIVS